MTARGKWGKSKAREEKPLPTVQGHVGVTITVDDMPTLLSPLTEDEYTKIAKSYGIERRKQPRLSWWQRFKTWLAKRFDSHGGRWT